MASLKKRLAAGLLFTSLVVFPMTALASSYDVSYWFITYLEGQTRYFDGHNIEVVLNSRGYDGYFKVELVRDGFLIDNKVGYGYAYGNGTSTIRWSNVGPGNYYTIFSKEENTKRIDGTGVYRNY